MNLPFDIGEVRERVVREIGGTENVHAAYITGSSVNGYYRRDSDIDVVLVTTDGRGEIAALEPDISIHRISPSHFAMYETARPYANLRMEPLLHAQYVQELSDRTKRAIVLRHATRLARRGKQPFTPWEVIENYLLRYAIDRPWRVTPIRRCIASPQARAILTGEYTPILEGLCAENRLSARDGAYAVNEQYVFHERPVMKFPAGAYLRESAYGWHVLRNLHHLARFALRS